MAFVRDGFGADTYFGFMPVAYIMAAVAMF
jgi:hypothetical protein